MIAKRFASPLCESPRIAWVSAISGAAGLSLVAIFEEYHEYALCEHGLFPAHDLIEQRYLVELGGELGV